MKNWLDVIEFFQQPVFKMITDELANERIDGVTILPAKENIFKAFSLTWFEDVKVVILGQDPYPNPQHAMGLAFSIPEGATPLPPTLRNIQQEVHADVGAPARCDLTPWAQQGVLLLNTSLTVIQGKPGSHASYWDPLINEVLKKLSEQREHLVFILWGSHAQRKAQFIDEEKHLIITSPHPSPLAAYRGFFGSKPFSRTNQYLTEHGKDPIVW